MRHQWRHRLCRRSVGLVCRANRWQRVAEPPLDDDSDHDTEQAPTAAPELAAPTTELPPASHAAEAAEAWSLGDTAEVDSELPRRWLSVGLVGLVVAVAGALILLAATLFSSHESKPGEPKAQPSTTMPMEQPDDYTADDLQFLNMYHRLISGWKAQPPGDEPASDPVAVSIAHDACRLINQSDDPGLANQRVSIDNGWSIQYAYQFVSLAMTAYPDCVGPSAHQNH